MKNILLLMFAVTFCLTTTNAQDLALVENTSFLKESADTDKATLKEKQENVLSEVIHQFLFSNIVYPVEARENATEGTVKGYVIISDNQDAASLKIVGKPSANLDSAVINAFEELDIARILPSGYIGSLTIPVKIKFTLALD